MDVLRACSKVLDRLVALLGALSVLLTLYCMLFGLADVILRYVFDDPSQWIGESIKMALILLACTAGAYSYSRGDFIRLDLFYAKFPARKKALFDLLTIVFAFLFVGVLIWKGTTTALFSIRLNQVTPTAIPLPVYPIKSLIPVAGVIMLLLLIRQSFRDVCTLLGKSLDEKSDSRLSH